MTKGDDKPTYAHEARFLEGYVIGVDEAGRGPWAGPVCAAAFWIDPHHKDSLPAALTDSKKLSAPQRAMIDTELSNSSHLFDFAFAEVAEIDKCGILQATFLAMGRAVDQLAERLLSHDPLGYGRIAAILVDGNLLPPLAYEAYCFVKGDSRVISIAAASIIAKQRRDALMAELHQAHPHYGWDRNQGYGTKTHQEAIAAYGITDHHRRSFKPIKQALQNSATQPAIN